MNWKLLLVVATLSLTTSLTACGKKDDAAAPDATKPADTSTPAGAVKGAGDAMKEGAAKTGDAMKEGAAKTGDAAKTGADAVKTGAGDAVKGAGDAMKGDKPATGTKPAEAPKKP
jgi:predicted small lipoprotein YifL